MFLFGGTDHGSLTWFTRATAYCFPLVASFLRADIIFTNGIGIAHSVSKKFKNEIETGVINHNIYLLPLTNTIIRRHSEGRVTWNVNFSHGPFDLLGSWQRRNFRFNIGDVVKNVC